MCIVRERYAVHGSTQPFRCEDLMVFVFQAGYPKLRDFTNRNMKVNIVLFFLVSADCSLAALVVGTQPALAWMLTER